MKSPLRLSRIKQIKRIKRIRKWKKRSVVILCCFIFLIGFLATLIYTNLGLRMITGVVEKVMPEMHFEQVSGALNDLKIEGFSLKLDGIDIQIEQVELAISGLCLIEGKVCVKALDVQQVVINIDTDAIASDSGEVVEEESTERMVINMPLPIELRKANLQDVSVNVDDMHFGLSSFVGSATWVNDRIYVFPSTAMDVKAVFADQPSLPAPAPVVSDEPLSISDTINQLFNQPLLASLPHVNIPLDIYVNRLQGDNWLLHIGGEDFLFNNIDIQANTENNFINAKLVQTDAKSPYINANIAVSGHITLGDDWPVNVGIKAKTEYRREQIPTEVNSQIQGNLLGTLTTTTQIKGLNRATVEAKIDFVETYLPLTAKIAGSYLQWPIVGQAQYQLDNFAVDLSGSVQKYHFDAKGQAKGEALPDIAFSLSSEGTNDNLSIKELSAVLPQGKFNLSGDFDWLNSLKWKSDIQFEQLDLTEVIPDYPIKLDGQLKTDGIVDSTYWAANITQMQIKGNINDAPLSASGSLAVNSNQYVVANHFNILWGDNKVQINGSTEQHNLVAHLDLPALSVIDPDLQGHIGGDVTVKGTTNRLSVDLDLSVNDLVWQDILLNHALLTGEIKYQEQLQGQIALKVNNLQLSESMAINQADIELSGDERNHKLTINIEGQPVSFASTLTGHLNQARTKWTGLLSDSDISLNDKNSWQLNKAVALSYDISGQKIQIGEHCWLNSDSSVCLDKKVTLAFTDKGEASVSLNNIDLTLFEFLNGDETQLAGHVHGNIFVKWDPTQAIPSIIANIDSRDVYIKQSIASQMLPIPFDLFSIKANINEKRAKLDWQFSLKEFGRFNGNIQVDEPTTQKKLSGKMVIDKLSLSIVNPLLENNEHADGLINSNLRFSGTLLDPYIHGSFDLAHSEIKSSQLPADIKSIMIDIDFYGKSSVLKGRLQTEAGEVNIDGKADWKDINHWNTTVTVNGAAINVTLPPMVTMTVIPDLKVEANQDQLNLTGRVTVPKGKIVVESLPPSSVDVSSDEVMLDNNLQEVNPQNLGLKINTRVLVTLGDDITVDAFGLTARLAGKVYVSQTDKGLSVSGQINVPSGRFHAYGQDLIIRKGEILFTGPPEQPHLNIEAIRNPESIENNVTAGIRVTGLADDPKVEVFSEPAMSQQEALSYLLRGQGLNSGEQGDDDMMTALLIGLGTAQGGKFIGDVGNAFGIKNLSLDTQGVGDGQKVVVSGYILPHLQLKYGIGIFDSLATFTLRYRLIPRLYLEATSGLDQTVDLIYQFEF